MIVSSQVTAPDWRIRAKPKGYMRHFRACLFLQLEWVIGGLCLGPWVKIWNFDGFFFSEKRPLGYRGIKISQNCLFRKIFMLLIEWICFVRGREKWWFSGPGLKPGCCVWSTCVASTAASSQCCTWEGVGGKGMWVFDSNLNPRERNLSQTKEQRSCWLLTADWHNGR